MAILGDNMLLSVGISLREPWAEPGKDTGWIWVEKNQQNCFTKWIELCRLVSVPLITIFSYAPTDLGQNLFFCSHFGVQLASFSGIKNPVQS